ncbi:lipase 3-like [Galleria mellonella]|uniref:Lipase n=1 Tax=Galleria mellonella TaxID=7137 RepID=A0A6J1WL32_GALME|nr:lipase 3-like [Galleria mellonella]
MLDDKCNSHEIKPHARRARCVFRTRIDLHAVRSRTSLNEFEMAFIVLIFVLCTCFIFSETQMRKEAYMSVPQLITSAGYPTEKHRVKTTDGYILQMHRIPAGRRTIRRSGTPNAKGKKAVLIVHGLLGSSSDFVIMGPDRSLGYILADAGYDVWLGNLRGNMYTAHQTLHRNNTEFWDYSFEEHGKLDAPAMIDKVLNVTGLNRLLYIGYSMGTTTFFTMMSQRPEYNDKIIAFIALAPAVYLDNAKFLANTLLKTVNIPATMRSRGIISATIDPNAMEFILTSFCRIKDLENDICMRVISGLVGEDYEQTDLELTPIFLKKMQPASWRQLEHFGKIAVTGVFTSWEDGLWGTVKAYNLSNVAVPVSLFYGENDQLTEKSQVMRLAAELNNTGVLESVGPSGNWPFNHLDFVMAKDIGNMLNRPLAKYVQKLFNKYDTD